MALTGLDDLLAEGEAGDGDELDVGHRQRDPNDGDGLCGGGGDVADRKPEPGDEEPDDVADPTHGAGSGRGNRLTPEGPQHVGGDAEGCDAGGDRDDEQAGDQTEEDVAEEEPEPAEDDPDDVE